MTEKYRKKNRNHIGCKPQMLFGKDTENSVYKSQFNLKFSRSIFLVKLCTTVIKFLLLLLIQIVRKLTNIIPKVMMAQWLSKLATMAKLSARIWVQVPPITRGVFLPVKSLPTQKSKNWRFRSRPHKSTLYLIRRWTFCVQNRWK